jgi:tetratricopeptide (TPR) repeat protein
MEKSYMDWCVGVAEGNPYFLTELTNHWIETGLEHEVPASLTAVLKRRISRLDQDALQVLQTCALLENNSTLPRIEAVLQQSAHALLKNINSLGSAGMIVAESLDASTTNSERVASRHDLLSNVAVTELTEPARRFLHRRIGQVLETEIDDHYSAATLWDCAKHWQMAGDQRRAWRLATSCASHLMKVGLPAAAAQAYQKSLAFCSTDSERLEVLSAQAAAYYRMSSWMALRETIAKVRSVQRHCSPNASDHDELELMDLRAQWQSLNWDSVLSKALSCLNARDADPAHRAEAGVMALMLLGFQGDEKKMSAAFRRIEELSDHPDVSEATKLHAQMVFHTSSGDIHEAVEVAKRLITEQQARGDIGDLFRAYCNAGVTCRVAGLFGEAAKYFSNALGIARKHNLQAAEQRALPLFANLALETGDHEQARTLYNQLCEIPLDPTNRYSFIERQGLAERLALCDGRKEDLRRFVPMTYEEAANDPIHHRRTYNLALYVIAELGASGRVADEAVEELEKSFSISRSGVHQAFNAFVLYSALKSIGKTRRARAMLDAYKTVHRREPWPTPDHLLHVIEKTCA